jgi:hypothetical protein
MGPTALLIEQQTSPAPQHEVPQQLVPLQVPASAGVGVHG